MNLEWLSSSSYPSCSTSVMIAGSKIEIVDVDIALNCAAAIVAPDVRIYVGLHF